MIKKIFIVLVILLLLGGALAWALGIRVDLVALKNRSTSTGQEETIELTGGRMVHGVIEVENDEIIVLGHGLGKRTEILVEDIVIRHPVEGSSRSGSDFSHVIYQDKKKNILSGLSDLFPEKSENTTSQMSEATDMLNTIQRDVAWRNSEKQKLEAELDRQAQAMLEGIAGGSSKKSKNSNSKRTWTLDT